MIGQYLLPFLTPLWARLDSLGNTYGVTPLAYHIAQTLTFLSTIVFMAIHMQGAGVAAFILHFIFVAVQRFSAQTQPSPTMNALHILGVAAATIFAIAFGETGIFGMPVAFLFLSWIVLILTNLSKPDILQLIGLFEIGCSVVVIGLAAAYIPAIAILFGLACLTSAAITLMMGTKVSD